MQWSKECLFKKKKRLNLSKTWAFEPAWIPYSFSQLHGSPENKQPCNYSLCDNSNQVASERFRIGFELPQGFISKELFIFDPSGSFLENPSSESVCTWYDSELCSVHIALPEGHLLNGISGSHLSYQLHEVALSRHWPKILQGKTEKWEVPKSFEKLQTFLYGWPWYFVQAGSESQGRAVNWLLEHWRHASVHTQSQSAKAGRPTSGSRDLKKSLSSS